MATLTQRCIQMLMPGSKNIQKCIQCVKAFSRQQKRALGSAISETGEEGGGESEKSTKSHEFERLSSMCASRINHVELRPAYSVASQRRHERAASSAAATAATSCVTR